LINAAVLPTTKCGAKGQHDPGQEVLSEEHDSIMPCENAEVGVHCNSQAILPEEPPNGTVSITLTTRPMTTLDIARLIDEGATAELTQWYSGASVLEIVEELTRLDPADTAFAFRLLPRDRAIEVFEELRADLTSNRYSMVCVMTG
jgi:hypothetical protein